jgi:uncharacterized membrane protein
MFEYWKDLGSRFKEKTVQWFGNYASIVFKIALAILLFILQTIAIAIVLNFFLGSTFLSMTLLPVLVGVASVVAGVCEFFLYIDYLEYKDRKERLVASRSVQE